jgi:hypothetical protein
MSTYQYPERSEIIDDGRPGRPASGDSPKAARESLPALAPEEFDLSEMEHFRLISVDDLDYLQESLREMADLLGVTAKGLRQLGVSPEEAAGTCAALERMLREVNAVAFAVRKL